MGEAPIGRVEDELVTLAGQLAAGTCRWLLLLAEFDRREGWAGWGIRSCGHWLSIRLAISPSTARADTSRAKMPSLKAMNSSSAGASGGVWNPRISLLALAKRWRTVSADGTGTFLCCHAAS